MAIRDIIGFNIARWMPIVLIALTLFHIFNLYGKLLENFDIPNFASSSELTQNRIIHGEE